MELTVLILKEELTPGIKKNLIRNFAAQQNLYIFCKSGKRSLRAIKELKKFGISGINIEGGIEALNN